MRMLASFSRTTIRFRIAPTSLLLGFDAALQGAWLEPFGLRNFLIKDPALALALDLKFVPAAPFVVPNIGEVYFNIEIYYNNLRNGRSGFPAALFDSSQTVSLLDEGNEHVSKIGITFWYMSPGDTGFGDLDTLKLPLFDRRRGPQHGHLRRVQHGTGRVPLLFDSSGQASETQSELRVGWLFRCDLEILEHKGFLDFEGLANRGCRAKRSELLALQEGLGVLADLEQKIAGVDFDLEVYF